MTSEPNKNRGETLMVGVAPVQSFVSKAIPIVPGMYLEPRRGRPARRTIDKTEQSSPNGQSESQGSKDSEPKTDS